MMGTSTRVPWTGVKICYANDWSKNVIFPSAVSTRHAKYCIGPSVVTKIDNAETERPSSKDSWDLIHHAMIRPSWRHCVYPLYTCVKRGCITKPSTAIW